MKNNFRFDYINIEQFLAQPNLLHDIKEGKLSGVIVKQFFNANEVATILKNYWADTTVKIEMPLNQGVTYPTVFAHVRKETGDDEKAIAQYFSNCEIFRTNFEQKFGVNAAQRIHDAFQSTSGERPVKVPHGVNGTGLYPFVTFRDLNPDTGEMTLHCGLYFYELFPEFYKHLHTIVADNNQLSFFTLLQKPEAGGEMTIFDVTRTEATKKIDDWQLESKKGELLHIEKNVDHIHLDIEAGDLLIFDGGTIWHRIEIVKGNKHRITLGGFIGFTGNDQEIYYWS
jgi:hypothetical protein